MAKQGAEPSLVTPREAEVFDLIARGLSDGEIAEHTLTGLSRNLVPVVACAGLSSDASTKRTACRKWNS